jgi:chromosomal replication initiation ATPase DnaA
LVSRDVGINCNASRSAPVAVNQVAHFGPSQLILAALQTLTTNRAVAQYKTLRRLHATEDVARESKSRPMKQIALDMGLTPEPTLGSFLPGPNAAAHEHLRIWAQGATRAPVPTYLWGESGSGKTHLLRAAAQALTAGGAAVGWITPQVAEPPEFNPAWQAVMLDDVQRFNAVQQRAAFKWFVDAQTT